MRCRPKIIILDGYTENPGDLSWDGLRALGELTVYDRTNLTDEQEAIDRISDAQIVIVNKTPITETILQACPKICYIGVLATGYNVVDVEAAKRRGIPVTNIPAYGTAAVAQFAIALLLEICHHIGHHAAAVQQGRWEQCPDWCFWDYPLIELAGKTMGIIGFGRIGRSTGKIAQALGMKVLAFDKQQDRRLENENCRYTDLSQLLQLSDVIALHCPLLPETEGIINRETLSKMKDGVIIINNSRGQLIVESDLREALESGKVAAAGLDVAATEPIRSDSPLLGAPNCFITPHISWASKESRERLMNFAVENVRAFLDGHPIHVVNQ